MINGHGDDRYNYPQIRLNFSSNCYNHFHHDKLFAYLGECMPSVVQYPEPDASSLVHTIGQKLHIDSNQIMVCNGATEGIYLIAQTFFGYHSFILTPTFSEYADACRQFQHIVSFVSKLDELPQCPQMVWLCNPNNPTGSVIDKQVLVKYIDSHPDTIFILDASYAKFTSASLLSVTEAMRRPNVLQLYSMTKDFGVPGLRLGYIISFAPLIHKIAAHRMPWSVNQLAICAGCYLMHHQDDYKIDAEVLIKEQKRVTGLLRAINGISVSPSDTHILLCRLADRSACDLKDYLAQKYGILIRNASNFEGLDKHYFRIAIQKPEENDELIKRIEEWMNI